MLTPFKLGLGGRLGSGRQWFWIHIDDIVGILRHALMTPAIDGPINASAPGIVINEEFTRELAAALNRPVFLPVPEIALRILMGEMAGAVMSSQRVFPQLALDTGYRFKYANLKPARIAVEDITGRVINENKGEQKRRRLVEGRELVFSSRAQALYVACAR